MNGFIETLTKFLTYLSTNYDEVLAETWTHTQLVGLAIIISIAIGVPLGIYLSTNEQLAETVIQITSVIMTIPSIALFGIMIPILSTIGQGIGFVPALIALVLYSQLPIVRNTYVAISNVDPNIKDAAIGIGMTPMQRLLKVEIPNAMPLIMAGVRQATVLNIGIGAIAAYIGSGGLGSLINQGIVRSNTNLILAGAVFVSILAIIADLILKYIQNRYTAKGVKN
ncbi:ABC transporter permease [Litoribacterium kuwaitense]|uniref:ABC transporter permease n=1 Tax=Litoribacterium kuwaitense TaxID=1398745 RepID=UPI001BAD83E9|nr:ABC transporter permease [Litoribacterium kuwaitense]